MKSLDDKGILFKLFMLLVAAVVFCVLPISFVVLMGWAKFEFNSKVIIAIILFLFFLLVALLSLLGFDKDITSETTDKKINNYFSKLFIRHQSLIIILYLTVLIILISYYVYLKLN